MSKSKGKCIVTNLHDIEKNKNQVPTQPVQPQNAINNASTNKACRYGRNCKRNDCKFYHAHLVASPNENVEDDDNDTFASWIPHTLYIVNGDNGVFEIKDKRRDLPKDQQVIEYCLVNVTSVVKSGENWFGNIVSAIKIDKSYFYERRKQILKKRRRYMRSFNGMDSNFDALQDESDLSESDDLPMMFEDNHLFTVDSRSCPIDFEKNLSLHEASNEWYLFNHYSINPITIEEVLSIDLSWKIPTTLMYIRKDFVGDAFNKALRRTKNQICNSVLNNDISIAQKIQRGSLSFVPLDLSKEMPKKGDIVAMDAEFVMLNHEETELRSDGTRSTIKPSHKSVARISCVRGSGQLGVPFIDDYICTQDQVADYMTKFSGLHFDIFELLFETIFYI